MLKELEDRIIELKRDIIEEICKKRLPRKVSIRCNDPYDTESPSVEICEVKKGGMVVEEYHDLIFFHDWNVETLICILEEMEGK